MSQKTHAANALEAAADRAKYDACAKQIFADKPILAHILQATVREFRDHPIDEIITCIEDPPMISSAPLYPGKTNQAITGLSTESKIDGEGEAYFDILFAAYAPETHEKLLIDVEIQNKFHVGYDIPIRAEFYGARILSSELDREFEIPDYQDIVRIYSIWVCIDCPHNVQGKIVAFPRTIENIFGEWTRPTRVNTVTPILVCLGKGKKLGQGAPLHHLLETIISDTLTVHEKLDILESEFGIKQSNDRKEHLNSMCNLSEGIFQKGIKQGIQEGIQQGVKQGKAEGATEANFKTAKNLRKMGMPMESIQQAIPNLTSAQLEAIEREQPEN